MKFIYKFLLFTYLFCLSIENSSPSLTLKETGEFFQNIFHYLGTYFKSKQELPKLIIKQSNETKLERSKRQLDYYGDYLYDYYDWICDERMCRLCNVLSSECCTPNLDTNCFLPDTCLNNPCLFGGTCISTRTTDNRPDFSCICGDSRTGKYCQLPQFGILG